MLTPPRTWTATEAISVIRRSGLVIATGRGRHRRFPGSDVVPALVALNRAAVALAEYAKAESARVQGIRPTPFGPAGHDCMWCGACLGELEQARHLALAEAEAAGLIGGA